MKAWVLFFAHRKVGLQPGPPEGEYTCRCGFDLQPGPPEGEYTCRCGFCSLHIRKLVFSLGLQKGNIHAGVAFVLCT